MRYESVGVLLLLFVVLFFIQSRLRYNSLILMLFITSKDGSSVNRALCCVVQGQMTVNGGLSVPASPRSHIQRPFSPSTYPPPPSLSPSITAMQQARTTGEC